MAGLAEKGGHLQPEDAEIELALTGNKFKCSRDDGDGAQVGEASRVSRIHTHFISQSPAAVKEDSNPESPAAVKEEDSNLGVVERNPNIDLSRDLAEVHPRPPPNHGMNELLLKLACPRHSDVINPWSVFLSSGAKTLSAGLYLFDYVSNIFVLRQYYFLYKHHKFGGDTNHEFYMTLVPFYVCLGFMIFNPVVAAVAFKLKLPSEENPLRSAFFLPIVQFQRFVTGIFKTGSCASALETTNLLETEALFAIMSAIETGPQLVLQFTIIIFLVSDSLNGWNSIDGPRSPYTPSTTLLISVIASFMSAAYNAGRAVMYQMSKRWTFTLNFSGVVGGIYTFGAILLRCTTVAYLCIVHLVFLHPFKHPRTTIFIQTLYFTGIILFSYINGLLTLLFKRRSLRLWTTQVDIIVAAYISGTIGPLYSIIEYNNSNVRSRSSHTPKFTLHVQLGLTVAISMLPDVLIILLLYYYNMIDVSSSSLCKHLLVGYSNSTLNCHRFISFFTLGVALSILPCIILPYLTSVASDEQCESNSDEVP